MNKTYRLCSKGCTIPHFENCETCYGFGVYKVEKPEKIGSAFPVTAGEAADNEFLHPVLACPECGSTEKGSYCVFGPAEKWTIVKGYNSEPRSI